jgi:uncharacterized membrane protein
MDVVEKAVATIVIGVVLFFVFGLIGCLFNKRTFDYEEIEKAVRDKKQNKGKRSNSDD